MPAILKIFLPNLVASPCNIPSFGSCAMAGSVQTAWWSGTRCRDDHSVASPPPPCSLWHSVRTATRFPASLPTITNAYHNLCSPSENTWWIWFGRTGGYQSLPHGTCTTIGGSGLVPGRITNTYHSLPSFRSEYLRRSFTFTISTSAAMDWIKYSHNET